MDERDDEAAAGRARATETVARLAAALHELTYAARYSCHRASKSRSGFQELAQAARARTEEVDASRSHVAKAVVPHLHAGQEIAQLVQSGVDPCVEVGAWHAALAQAVATFEQVDGAADGVVKSTRAVQTACGDGADVAQRIETTLTGVDDEAAAWRAGLARIATAGVQVDHLPTVEQADRWLAERLETMPGSTQVEGLRQALPPGVAGVCGGLHQALAEAVNDVEVRVVDWCAAYEDLVRQFGAAGSSSVHWLTRPDGIE